MPAPDSRPRPRPRRREPVAYLEQPCRTALNRVRGMGFSWSLNPYTGCAHRCTFCYVRAFERRADRPSDERYGRLVRVKTNVAEVLRHELARRSWRRELVALGTATDPYQPAEGRWGLTRGCLEALRDFRTPVDITTRGPMVVRDAALLAEMGTGNRVSVAISIPTLDDEIWLRTEPGTAHPRARLRALRTLAKAGVRVGVALAPVLPGLTDDPAALRAVAEAAREAGAGFLWGGALRLQPGTREHFLTQLAHDFPWLASDYATLYSGRASLPAARIAGIERSIGAARRGLTRGRPAAPPHPRPPTAAPPRQLALRLGG